MNFRLACSWGVLLVGRVGPKVGTPEADSAPAIETRPDVAVLTGPLSAVDGKPVRVRVTLYERDAAGQVERTYTPLSAEAAATFCATN